MDQRKRVEEYEQAGCYHNNVNKQTNSRCDWGKKMQMWQSTVLCTLPYLSSLTNTRAHYFATRFMEITDAHLLILQGPI